MQQGYWGTFALMIVGLLGALWLQSGLDNAAFELFLILLAIIAGGLILIGVHTEHAWAWKLALLYFAFLLLNAGIVFANITNHIIAFGLAALAPLFGLMLALMHVSEPFNDVVATTPAAPKKRGRPKKK